MGKVELRIEVDADLVSQAKAAGVMLDSAVEAGLRQALLETSRSDNEKAAAWAVANAESIEDHRCRIDTYGVFGEDLRTW